MGGTSIDTRARTATVVISLSRVALGVCVLAVLGYTYVLGIPVDGANPFNYFGYFTNLTSLLTALMFIAVGAGGLSGLRPTHTLNAARAALVACMIIVGVIYNTLIPGTGSAPAWVSAILHLVFPVAAVLDWALVGDRDPLPWRRLWVVLPYPLIWLAVVLVRGVTDGWVPYGFLLPSHGMAWKLAHVGGLLVALLVAAVIAWALSRVRGVPWFVAAHTVPSGQSDTAMPVSAGRDAQDLLK